MGSSRAVLLPGTASDGVFVRSVFAAPLASAGLSLITPAGATVEEHLAALDAAYLGEPLIVGGVSLGAHVAAAWAARTPERCAGLLLALPAWSGPAAGAPAALAAAVSAEVVERDGVDAALAGVDGWLGAELSRAWRGHGAALAGVLRAASSTAAPTLGELAALDVPAGVAACTDDPVHPLAVAQQWAAALPRGALRTTTLAELGTDRTALGRAAVAALLDSRAGADGATRSRVRDSRGVVTGPDGRGR
ncbi:alpha/beta fold hydrolase [Saccharothrix coeruleofusca]|uniref:Thioesterase n=1 Tax=Saccharothrix coeruleofusca TaxID=33919 RepID=A0A918AJA4_9PSEU|nr:alpha/beta hydrolase [Saccharothrix coeruleofusca]GGP40269.1 thioesterase [Saccharothrix coeruleofusca]